MPVRISRRHFSVADYYRMAEAGILSEEDRVELINGEIIEMTPIGSRHAACVDRLNRLLNQLADLKAIVRVQSPIRLDDYSEPQPDVSLLRPRPDFYVEGHPTPADVLLVIEVAETSAAFDREVKLPLYARVMLPEVWLIDLPNDTIETYTQPLGGEYRTSKRARRGESLDSPTVPGLALNVEAILG